MIKKSIITTLILFGLFLGSDYATATETNVAGSEEGTGAKSHGHVIITPKDGTTEPEKPIEPSDPSGSTGNKGALTINNVTPLLFGAHQLEGGKQTFTVTSKKPNVDISDNRGDKIGWDLQVTSSSFVDKLDATKTLKGAVIVIPVGELKTTEGNVSDAPAAYAVELDTTKPVSATIMSATSETGKGQWANIFDEKAVKLIVPAGNLKGEYLSTLTWSLIDAPK